ncbi:Imm6 family immunity protein [Thermoactinomyces intermedius]|uniref:Imm6 family immunity protein n=1 Tax=Thermoactinomyces intermedius TaxID=2024 RepID=UPI0028684871|nr:Imm6 family immunity protein [Thermoactinomyces intermedius]
MGPGWGRWRKWFVFEAIYEEIVHDAQIGLVWFSLLDAICYTTWRAFLYERKKSLPQTLELESDETIDQFTDKVTKINGYQEQWAERL